MANGEEVSGDGEKMEVINLDEPSKPPLPARPAIDNLAEELERTSLDGTVDEAKETSNGSVGSAEHFEEANPDHRQRVGSMATPYHWSSPIRSPKRLDLPHPNRLSPPTSPLPTPSPARRPSPDRLARHVVSLPPPPRQSPPQMAPMKPTAPPSLHLCTCSSTGTKRSPRTTRSLSSRLPSTNNDTASRSPHTRLRTCPILNRSRNRLANGRRGSCSSSFCIGLTRWSGHRWRA